MGCFSAHKKKPSTKQTQMKSLGKDSFLRPIGAAADVAEIEYIIALHQATEVSKEAADITASSSGKEGEDNLEGDSKPGKDTQENDSTTLNAVLTSDDVHALLRSKYGVIVNSEDIQNHVFRNGFSAGSPHEDGLDPLHIVAALLIPRLWQESQAKAGPGKSSNQIDGDSTQPVSSFVLPRLLEDCVGSSEAQPLTAQLLRRIFRKTGLESVIAENDGLLEEMIHLASLDAPGDDTPSLLDESTFLRALTRDLALYKDQTNKTIPCPFEATLETQEGKLMSSAASDGDNNVECPTDQYDPVKWVKLDSLSAIDFTGGTFFSRGLAALLWGSFLLTYVAYFFRLEFARTFEPTCPDFESRGTWSANRKSFGCTILWTWCRFLYISIGMGIYGVVYMCGAGLGNLEQRKDNLVNLIVATTVSGALAIIPLLFFHGMIEGAEYVFIGKVAFAFGLLVFLWNLKHLAAFCICKATLETNTEPGFFPLFANRLAAESWNQQAGWHKTNGMIQNAMRLAKESAPMDNVFQSNAGRIMYRFVSESENPPKEQVGGLRWTWQRIQSGNMFCEEGVWYSGRLLASNFVQLILVIFLLIAGVNFLLGANDQFSDFPAVRKEVDALFREVKTDISSERLTSVVNRQFTTFLANEEVRNGNCLLEVDTNSAPHCNDVEDLTDCILNNGTDFLCTLVDYNRTTSPEDWQFSVQNNLLQLSGLTVDEISSLTLSSLKTYLDDSIATLYPEERYMVTLPIVIGIICAVLAAVRICLEILPATTMTILKFRCGEHPSLRDPRFATRRNKSRERGPQFVGHMFWGVLVSALLISFVFGAFTFFIVWHVTRKSAQWLIAVIIGVLLLHFATEFVSTFTLVRLGDGFYRKEPKKYNLILLARDTAYFAISFAALVSRASKVLASGITYCGRIHRQILTEDASDFMSLQLDNSHEVFLATVLQHEAHRHPYIDLLSTLYAAKILNPREFATRAGCAWRLLLTAHLFPWLNDQGETPKQSRSTRHSVLHRLSVYQAVENKEDHIERSLRQENERLQELLRQNGIPY